ncbi:WD40 repeat domain-containing serine/threonine protein kinase [Enhygromyxa salina]|uniref:WD40 repeat domain-containing serine/threonine protein kinase n=1 Tax=Enhygromyxa salina TaxID=215803 RepID=UPI0015E65B9F|nr:WD40 repeat domain-containing serine/threonine-protein kinase [Enhygromyxa salina]
MALAETPTEGIMESTLDSAEQVDGVEQRRLRNLVHERVFGEAPDVVTIGRFLVLERIGSGAMGAVFSAYDKELDRKIAIKLLHEQTNTNPARLVREAQVLARLSHPNVVQVLEVGVSQSQVFVAMEYVEGQSLREWVRASQRSVAQIIDVYLQAGRGLAAAHAAGIVHRDFKPDNVIVGDDGRVRVVDFGVARRTAEGPPTTESPLEDEPDAEPFHPTDTLTRTGRVVGTPAYMAPEQHTGGELDGRTDQFGFCVSLYESLYRARPFVGNTYAKLVANVVAGSIVTPTSDKAPRWLRELLTRGLSREPGQRFPDMDALLRELARDRETRRRRRVGLAVLGAATLVAALAWTEREHEHAAVSEALASEAQSEGQRADQAELDLLRRQDAVILAEAGLALPDDPGLALERLRQLSDDMPWPGAARTLASDARQLGVPLSSMQLPESLTVGPMSDDGRRSMLIEHGTREIWMLDVELGKTWSTGLKLTHDAYAISSDGRFIGVGERVNGHTVLALHDVQLGLTQRLQIPEDREPVVVWLAPDGARVAGQTSDGRTWIMDRSGMIQDLGPRNLAGVVFVPERDALVGVDEEARLVLVSPGAEARVIARDVAAPIRPSPAGDRVAVRSGTGLRVVPLDGGEPRELSASGDDQIWYSAWDPLGQQLAASYTTRGGVVFDVDGDARTELRKRESPFRWFAFSRDGSKLAFASEGDAFVTWLPDGHSERYPGHEAMGWGYFDSHDHLRTIDWQGTLRVWSTQPRHLVRRVPGPAQVVAWSSRDLLALGTFSGLAVTGLDGSEPGSDPIWESLEHGAASGVAWSADGSQLASIHTDGSVRSWTHEGDLIATSSAEHGRGSAATFLADDRLAWIEDGVGVHVGELGAGASELWPVPELTTCKSVERDAARGWLWVAGWSTGHIGLVVAFDERTGAEVYRGHLSRDGLIDLAVLADGRLVYATFLGDVVLLDPGTGQRSRLGSHHAQVFGVAADPLGGVVYSASLDGSARVWELETGRFRALRVDEDSDMHVHVQAMGIAVAPGGGRFASSYSDATVRIWGDDLPHDWPALREWLATQPE